MDDFFALLLAGGRGARLWPLSRPERPKPLLSLLESRSLFQLTVDRLEDLFEAAQMYVVTQPTLAEALQSSAPAIPAANFVYEPSSRDTAPAIGLSVFHIAQQHPDAVLAILSTDHAIAHTDRLRAALRAAYPLAQQGAIVVLGITPTHPATEYGYIEHGACLSEQGLPAYRVRRFVEKPDRPTADSFLATGGYSWDAGFVIASARTLMAEFERQRPDMARILRQIVQSPDHIDPLWAQLEAISFDYAILEHARDIAVIPVDMGWSDVGTWAAVYEALPKDTAGNVAVAPATHMIGTQRTLVWSQKLVVTIGLEDLVIVDTPDALLICRRDQVGQIRALEQKVTQNTGCD